MHESAHRNKRVFAHLRALCVTDEARGSLEEFQRMWEEREADVDDEGGEKLARKNAASAVGAGSLKMVRRNTGPGSMSGKGVKEKKGWLEGLIGGVGRKFS